VLSARSYVFRVKGITIKLPDELHRRLAAEARDTGQSIAAIVRARLQEAMRTSGSSVYDQAADLAGALAGSRRAATNDRKRFRRA
jgi:predicted transcriptional regulator